MVTMVSHVTVVEVGHPQITRMTYTVLSPHTASCSSVLTIMQYSVLNVAIVHFTGTVRSLSVKFPCHSRQHILNLPGAQM